MIDGPLIAWRALAAPVRIQHEHALGVAQHRMSGCALTKISCPLRPSLVRMLSDHRSKMEPVCRDCPRLIDQQRLSAVEQQDRQDGRALLARGERQRVLVGLRHPSVDPRQVEQLDGFQFE